MNQYIIISLKHSEKGSIAFWRKDDAGYTTNPWQAGIYSEEQISNNQDYYNDGLNAIAVCVTNSSLTRSGLKIDLNLDKIKAYRRDNLGQINH